MEHSYVGNKFVSAFESLILNNPQRVVWAGDYADKCKGLKTNVYDRCTQKNEVEPTLFPTLAETRFIINHTKRQFVDKQNLPKEKWQIHPLPLLTSEGCGQGGGDYFSQNDVDLVGSWARDLISVSNVTPKGFKELTVKFSED